MIFFNDIRYFLKKASYFTFSALESEFPDTYFFQSLLKGDRSVVNYFINDILEKVKDYEYSVKDYAIQVEMERQDLEEILMPVIHAAEDRFFSLYIHPAALELHFMSGLIYYKKNRTEYDEWKSFTLGYSGVPGCPDTVIYDLIICAEVLSLHKRNGLPRYPEKFCIDISDNEKEYSSQINRAHKALRMFLNNLLKDIRTVDIFDVIKEDLLEYTKKTSKYTDLLTYGKNSEKKLKEFKKRIHSIKNINL